MDFIPLLHIKYNCLLIIALFCSIRTEGSCQRENNEICPKNRQEYSVKKESDLYILAHMSNNGVQVLHPLIEMPGMGGTGPTDTSPGLS